MESETAISEGLAKMLAPIEELKEKILRRRMKDEERRELMERLAKMKAERERDYLEYQEELERIRRKKEALAAKIRLREEAIRRDEETRKKKEARRKKCLPERCDESHLLPAVPVLQEPGDSTCLVSVPGSLGPLSGGLRCPASLPAL